MYIFEIGSSNVFYCSTEKKCVIMVLYFQQHFCKDHRMMLRSEVTMKTLFFLLIVPSNFCLCHVSFSYKDFYFFSCSLGGSEASGMMQNCELKSELYCFEQIIQIIREIKCLLQVFMLRDHSLEFLALSLLKSSSNLKKNWSEKN